MASGKETEVFFYSPKKKQQQQKVFLASKRHPSFQVGGEVTIGQYLFD